MPRRLRTQRQLLIDLHTQDHFIFDGELGERIPEDEEREMEPVNLHLLISQLSKPPKAEPPVPLTSGKGLVVYEVAEDGALHLFPKNPKPRKPQSES